MRWLPPIPIRLIDSSDPYLLEHAHNPVDWYPWGPAAFAKAKAENKPIFLSIGYSTCYWCHVAQATIYANPQIAALMNQWFVNVKVDREQRPDVDRLYVIATEMLTGKGAWPNNLFLTPEGRPFYAGSYFPPEDTPESPGFPTVLAAIHDLWDHHRADKVDPVATAVTEALRKARADQAGAAPVAVRPEAWMRQAVAGMLRMLDPYHGGFGHAASGPKFPQAPGLELLLTDEADPTAKAALLGTLDAMANGGIHDQLGGGFHRYATEPTWSIPHFEKMLYDNAQLLALYARGYALTQAPSYRDVAQDIGLYLVRDMAAPGGGFATAQDAVVNGIEGANVRWTRAQIEAVLGATETDAFLGAYTLTPMPDAASGSADAGGVLRVKPSVAANPTSNGGDGTSARLAAFASDRAKLLAARQARPQPLRDDKIVTSLNGLAIGAFAHAGTLLQRPDYVGAATQAAVRLWTAFDAPAGRLAHQIFKGKAAGDGELEDYAMLADGYLALAEATHDGRWHDKAVALADALLKRFMAPDGRLAGGDDGLLVTLEDSEDADVPSGASVTLDVLARLGEEPDGARFEDAAAKVATHLSGTIAKRPEAWPAAIVALIEHPLKPDALAAAATAISRVQVARAEPNAPAIPTTSDHVHASAKVVGDTVAVTLAVDPGYHINAHQPSFDYLVPTAVAFTGLTPSSVAYPAAIRFTSRFAPGGLDVYEGAVDLVAAFPAGALSGVVAIEGSVTTQACDLQTCLPPATLPISAATPR